MYSYIAIFATCIFLFSIFSAKTDKWPISGPLLFVAAGVILGPKMLDLMDFSVRSEQYKILVELALGLVLFTEASKVKLTEFMSSLSLPSRLLFLGLPLTILTGFGVAYILFPEFLWIELALLATVLAPTDAALGQAVVTNKFVPAKIREALNVESGLNDGICVPVLLLFIAVFATDRVGQINIKFALGLFARVIGLGLLVGVVVMYLGSKLIVLTKSRAWMSEGWKPLILIALAFTVFSLAQLVGGSGFIACFAGGFVYGAIKRKYSDELEEEEAEGIGNSLTFITWIIFGSFVLSNHFAELTWDIVLYALISLTLIRMLPVFLVLAKSGLAFKEKMFIGWFGPRGLASIVFGIILLDVGLPHQKTLVLVVFCTVFFSVVLHGISANPLANIFRKKT